MRKSIWLFLMLFPGCTRPARAPAVHISLVNNNRSVEFIGLDPAIMGEISRDSTQDIWENLIPVYRMPADTDMKDYQPVQHGSYQLKDSSVMFTPDTPFAKSKAYFIRYYQFNGGNNVWDFIKGKKKLGSERYIDLVF